MKSKFNRNQKRVTTSDIKLSSVIFLLSVMDNFREIVQELKEYSFQYKKRL